MDERHGADAQGPKSPGAEWQSMSEVSLPQPTYAPGVLALGITFVLWGTITSAAISAVGALLMAVALWQWIGAMCRGK